MEALETVSHAAKDVANSGPWAAAFVMVFIVFVGAVWWYVRTNEKKHHRQIEQQAKNNEKQIDIVIDRQNEILKLTSDVLIDRLKALDDLQDDLDEKFDKLNQMCNSLQHAIGSICVLDRMDGRKSVLSDLADEVILQLPVNQESRTNRRK